MLQCDVKIQKCKSHLNLLTYSVFSIAKYSAVSLENEISTQWHSHSRYIRDGIQAVKSTIQLANGCTAIMPTEENAGESDPDYGTECTVSFNLIISHITFIF
jgi:hypothetical protein